MIFVHRSATEWAEDHSLAAEVQFARLESVAFQGHPDIYERFGRDGATLAQVLASARQRRTSPTLVAAGVVGMFIVFLMPIFGAVILPEPWLRRDLLGAEQVVPVSGVTFGAAAVGFVLILALWVVTKAHWNALLFGFALASVASSIFALVVMPGRALRAGLIGWEGWLVPIWGNLVVSAIVAVALLCRFRARGPVVPKETPRQATTMSDVNDIRTRVAALPVGEREAIEVDRAQALDVLYRRGLIDGELLARAEDCDLGTLFVLDERR